MNAYKFVEQYGLEEAKEKVSDCEFMECESFSWNGTQSLSVSEIKQAIADFELINWHGGLKYAKSYFERNSKEYPDAVGGWVELEVAITRIEGGLRDE